jgi:hypothetical protein
LSGTATIGENSCGADSACERVTGNLQISGNSCNGHKGEICFELTLLKWFYFMPTFYLFFVYSELKPAAV